MRLTRQEFDDLFERFESESLHVEMRDMYGTQAEIGPFAKWVAGEPDDLKWLDGWCETLRRGTAKGKVFRRVCVVSEPLSDYQRWTHSLTSPLVEAGEDIRWVPRRLVSSIPVPGNDFYLIDEHKVVFMHYSGVGAIQDIVVSTERSDVDLCRAAVDSLWGLAVPHQNYEAF